MEKIKLLPWEADEKQSEEPEINLEKSSVVKKHKRYQGYKEDPFVFMSDNDIVWPQIR